LQYIYQYNNLEKHQQVKYGQTVGEQSDKKWQREHYGEL